MNKKEFIKQLSEKIGYSEEDCTKINTILEDYFLIGKKNKGKIIIALKEKLNISDDDASNIYEIAMDILSNALKDRLKNPFKSLD